MAVSFDRDTNSLKSLKRLSLRDFNGLHFEPVGLGVSRRGKMHIHLTGQPQWTNRECLSPVPAASSAA
jgi:hypothetical protein